MTNVSQQKSHARLILILLVMVAIFTSAVMYFGVIKKTTKSHKNQLVKIEGVYLPTAKEISDFNLMANNGKSFTKENMKGHWTMMFFGFTNCGYVCPTTMTELNKMYQVLKKELPEGQMPQVVLVSVDPERDSVSRMNDYVNSFNSQFIGARADLKETEALENQLHISAVKMQAEGQSKDHYMVNHSSEILLFNPEAKIQAYFSFPHKSDLLVRDYKACLQNA